MDKKEQLDAIFAKEHKFKEQLSILRDLLNSTELVETIKWAIPTYTINSKNVVGLTAFKNHYGLWFFNGCFLTDPHNLLRNAQKGKTKGMRHLNFTENDLLPLDVIKGYVLEAIENEKEGKKITVAKAPKVKDIIIPSELKEVFDKNKSLKIAFKTLTPGRQKEYVQHIESAKQEKTRLGRLKKAIPLILDGKGLYDKYK